MVSEARLTTVQTERRAHTSTISGHSSKWSRKTVENDICPTVELDLKTFWLFLVLADIMSSTLICDKKVNGHFIRQVQRGALRG